jgi:hypothetical protein
MVIKYSVIGDALRYQSQAAIDKNSVTVSSGYSMQITLSLANYQSFSTNKMQDADL